MSLVMAATKRASFSRSGNLLIALYCLAIAHILEAGLYAVGFSLGEGIGIGGFAQANVETFMDVFYLFDFFSLLLQAIQ